MAERVRSFRLDEESERILRILMEEDQMRLGDGTVRLKSGSQEVRDALKFYGAYRLSEEHSDFQMYRMKAALCDVIDQKLPVILHALNTMQERTMILHQLVRAVCSAIEFGGSEEERMKLLEEVSLWDLCAEKKVREEIRKAEIIYDQQRNGSDDFKGRREDERDPEAAGRTETGTETM